MATSNDVIKFIHEYYSSNFEQAIKILDKNKPFPNSVGRPPKGLGDYYEFYKTVEILISFAPLDEHGKETGKPLTIEKAIEYIEKEKMYPDFIASSAKYYAVKKEIEKCSKYGITAEEWYQFWWLSGWVQVKEDAAWVKKQRGQ